MPRHRSPHPQTCAVSRFSARQSEDEDEAELWRSNLQAFLNLYSFLSQVIPYQDSDLEQLYVFLRHLSAKLPRRRGGPSYQFDDDVRLEYYRLQKISEGSISLRDGYSPRLEGPSEVGTGAVHEEPMLLSRLIDIINERFATDFNQADQLFLDLTHSEILPPGRPWIRPHLRGRWVTS